MELEDSIRGQKQHTDITPTPVPPPNRCSRLKRCKAPQIYIYHWALNKTALYGANHGDQMRCQTYNTEVRSISPAQDEVAGFMNASATSFIVTGDPNKTKVRWPERPEWLAWKGVEKTMVFGESNDERAGGTGVRISADFSKYDQAEKQCEFQWKHTESFGGRVLRVLKTELCLDLEMDDNNLVPASSEAVSTSGITNRHVFLGFTLSTSFFLILSILSISGKVKTK